MAAEDKYCPFCILAYALTRKDYPYMDERCADTCAWYDEKRDCCAVLAISQQGGKP